MVAYLAMQILKGKISYTQTVEKFPQYKEDIDLILITEGREDLINSFFIARLISSLFIFQKVVTL